MVDHLTEDDCRLPKPGDKVYKDECILSFDNPESETGLYISLKTFVGVGKNFVEMYHKRTDSRAFLNYRVVRKKKVKKEEEEQAQKRTRLALGVEGGFALDEAEFLLEEHYSLVVLPAWHVVPLPADLPEYLQRSIQGVKEADSARKVAELEAAAWDGGFRAVSHAAQSLVQLDNGVKVPPSGWRCSRCDLQNNLWLNLTDGSILCGRRFWDGSGGNNHAVDHFKETGYPLAVKLGTITPEGADVFCYTEDDMVEDPLLADHLAHFGIDIMKMQKTDKSMMELEIDVNEKLGNEWMLMQEHGSGPLQPLYGPGYTGMHNLGNSCYINASMQVLFSIPEFTERYALSNSDYESLCGKVGLTNTPTDFGVQMSKLARGLTSGDYSTCPGSADDGDGDVSVMRPNGVRPFLFKGVIGKDHREFASKRQQDAQEFLLHLFDLMDRHQVKESAAPGSKARTSVAREVFGFTIEDRLQCLASQRVGYQFRDELLLPLPIPMDKVTNAEEVAAYRSRCEALGKPPQDEEPVRPCVRLTDCLAACFETAVVDGFYSSAVKTTTQASKRLRMGTFPRCLMLQARRFLVGDDWIPKKLDVALQVPDHLDLTEFSFDGGLQPGEEPLPTEPVTGGGEPAVRTAPAVDEAVVRQVAEMGFPEAACRKAIIMTNNTGVEAAMGWIMEHMDDADFNDPLPETMTGGVDPSPDEPSPEAVETLVSMGFSSKQARKALRCTDNNVERAVDWLFSHPDDQGEEQTAVSQSCGPNSSQSAPKWTGSCMYELFAFISHMGTSMQTGHYVCHVKKDGRWVIFNDEKVALSERPPRQLAYLYFYRRLG